MSRQSGGRQRVDDRAQFAAIVFVLTSGCACRHLSPSFGVTVHPQRGIPRALGCTRRQALPQRHPAVHPPLAGDLTLNYDALELPADPGQTIPAYTAERGSPAQHVLDRLATPTAAPDDAAAIISDLDTRPSRPPPQAASTSSRKTPCPSSPSSRRRRPRLVHRRRLYRPCRPRSAAVPGQGHRGPLHSGRPHRLALPHRQPDLYVTEGVGLHQPRGGQVEEIHAGDVIVAPSTYGTGTAPHSTGT